MTTRYENVKGNKGISVDASAHVKDAHEHASGKSSGPRGASNGVPPRESKAMKHAKKK
ncbi:MAG: hypothetical protein WCT04_20835 [Planctomycetota bacterium]